MCDGQEEIVRVFIVPLCQKLETWEGVEKSRGRFENWKEYYSDVEARGHDDKKTGRSFRRHVTVSCIKYQRYPANTLTSYIIYPITSFIALMFKHKNLYTTGSNCDQLLVWQPCISGGGYSKSWG